MMSIQAMLIEKHKGRLEQYAENLSAQDLAFLIKKTTKAINKYNGDKSVPYIEYYPMIKLALEKELNKRTKND